MNRLYFGDNLKWLCRKREFPDASVDRVYRDPPFNSNADYNVLVREPSGAVSQAQFHAFTDTWSWADAAEMYHQFIDNCPNVAVVEMMEGFSQLSEEVTNDGVPRDDGAAPRRTASRLERNWQPLPTLRSNASPYLRTLFDNIFGAENLRNEIIWQRTPSKDS